MTARGARVAADQNELRIVEPLRDATHHLRSMSAEHDDAGRSIWVELQLEPLGPPIDVERPVEIRANDHSGGRMNARLVVAGGSGLPDRFGGTANQMLRLIRLDPKMRG
jgi:hypothetical protein